MTIRPDTKDWTWVLDRPCPECGYDASAIAAANVAVAVRGNAEGWAPVLCRADVRQRPNPSTWSPLEYGCHVRDVFRLYDYRLSLMLEQDDPLYPNWDQDVTAVEERYDQQDAAVVAPELRDAAAAIADRFDTVTGEQWQRRGRRSDGASFTVDSFARYFLHDVVHHLHDVGG
ncbi:MAG TPA: DinB family protein [Mycobacteriales bacterium]|nr:DinB family protein [Mycobacteriales bacterium]